MDDAPPSVVRRLVIPVALLLLTAPLVGAQIVNRERPVPSPATPPEPAPPPAPVTQPTFSRPGMVLLLRDPARFTEDKLAIVLMRMTGEKFARSPKGPNYFAQSRFVDTWDIVHGDMRYELFTGDLLPMPERRWPGPDLDHPEEQWAYRNATGEVRVVWANPIPGDPERTATAQRFIGTLLAELMNDDCLAVMRLTEGPLEILARTPLTARELKSVDPAQATRPMRGLPAREIDRERIDEAIAQAQANWPIFLDALEMRNPGDVFAVRVRTADALTGGGFGQLLLVESVAEDRINAYAPLASGRGPRVQVEPSKVIDWVVCRSGRIEGRFLMNVAREIRLEMRERGIGGN